MAKQRQRTARTTTGTTRTRPAAAPTGTGVTVAAKGGKLTRAMTDRLKECFKDDEWLYGMATQVAKLGTTMNQTAIVQRHTMGTLFREIKGKRKEGGIKAVCSATSISLQIVYDMMTLSERITSQQLTELLEQNVQWTTLRTLAMIADRGQRSTFIKRLCNGETVSVADISNAVQQTVGRRGNGGRPVTVPKTVSGTVGKLSTTATMSNKVLATLTDSLVIRVSEMPPDTVTDELKDQVNDVYKNLNALRTMLGSECSKLRTTLDVLGLPVSQVTEDLDDELEEEENEEALLDVEPGEQDPAEDDALAHAGPLDDEDDDEDDEDDEDEVPRTSRTRARSGMSRINDLAGG